MQTIVIWDKFIRLFHWSIVALFFLNYFITEDELHDYLGYVMLALLVARVFWGFYGSHHARFASFFPTISKIKQHLTQLQTGQVPAAEGHNPLGGLMILLLLSLLTLICITGVMMGMDRFWGVEWVETLHQILAKSVLIAVPIHISAVLVMSKISNINLIKTMITGRRDV